jgi:[acyl-carrier-protein] S-malonyltransferase
MLAFIFPGQGSQRVGMGRELVEAYPAAAQMFDEVASAAEMDLRSLCWDGPQEALTETGNAQVALLAVDLACLAAARECGLEAGAVAGHSLGEYVAVVAAGGLAPSEAARLVRRRGELMAQAGRDSGGTMTAVLGLETDAVEALCAESSDQGVVVAANYNCPGQVVISGEREAVKSAAERAKAQGARCIPLRVSGAFHSPLMEPAAAEFRAVLEGAPVRDAGIPIVANATGEVVTTAAEIREALARQMISPVRWEQSVRRMRALGAEAFVELGPGDVLSGLVRRTDAEAQTVGISDLASLRAAAESLASAVRGQEQ